MVAVQRSKFSYAESLLLRERKQASTRRLVGKNTKILHIETHTYIFTHHCTRPPRPPQSTDTGWTSLMSAQSSCQYFTKYWEPTNSQQRMQIFFLSDIAACNQGQCIAFVEIHPSPDISLPTTAQDHQDHHNQQTRCGHL